MSLMLIKVLMCCDYKLKNNNFKNNQLRLKKRCLNLRLNNNSRFILLMIIWILVFRNIVVFLKLILIWLLMKMILSLLLRIDIKIIKILNIFSVRKTMMFFQMKLRNMMKIVVVLDVIKILISIYLLGMNRNLKFINNVRDDLIWLMFIIFVHEPLCYIIN